MLGHLALKCIDVVLRRCGRSTGETTGTNYVVLCKKQDLDNVER